jgi:hypothetical protein
MLSDVFDYFRTYDRASFGVFSCQGSEPTERDLSEFERSAGFSLPEEFRKFTVSPLGGLYMEVHEELWPRPVEFQVGPFWSFLYGLKVFGISVDIPAWLDIRVQHDELKAAGFIGLVPFLQVVGDANKYCFAADGSIILWDHEQPDVGEHRDITFSELLMEEIADLEERKSRKIRGEDKT